MEEARDIAFFASGLVCVFFLLFGPVFFENEDKQRLRTV
jgi:hypothetical protein